MAQGLKPSDNPVIVREFETRLLLVVLPVFFFFLIIFILYFSKWELVPFIFFSNWELAPFIFRHFSVFLLFFDYTPMEVVPPVGMLVCTAAYTLAADGAVLNTPKTN